MIPLYDVSEIVKVTESKKFTIKEWWFPGAEWEERKWGVAVQWA